MSAHAVAASARVPRLYQESAARLYKPASFYASGHHAVRHAHWLNWTSSHATASAVVYNQFAAAPVTHRHARVRLTRPGHRCGVYTFTRISADGRLIARLDELSSSLCIWYVQ